MESLVLTVEQNQNGIRLDVFLATCLDEFSRSYLQKLILNGQVALSGNPLVKKNLRLKAGDIVELAIPAPEELDVKAENIPLDIIFEDEGLLVVNKGKGMVVHPAPGNYEGTLVNALLYHCDNLSSINGVIRPGIVHRIDKNTTGLLVVAKTDLVHKSLAEQLKRHEISRIYYALVEGVFGEESGTVDAPVGRDPFNRLKMAVTDKGKKAITHFKVMKRFSGASLLQCRLETGRTHQIRVHLSYIGHPIIGDALYGFKKKTL